MTAKAFLEDRVLISAASICYAAGTFALDNTDGVYDGAAHVTTQFELLSNFIRLAPSMLYAAPFVGLGLLLSRNKKWITQNARYTAENIIDWPDYKP
jgi:hypothetical protein